MKPAAGIESFLDPLITLQRLLDHFPGKGVIIGGIASSILGTSRLTVDLDALILLQVEEIPVLMRTAEKLGLTPRIDAAAEFARKNLTLLLRHNQSGVNIDIILGMLPFEHEIVERSQVIQISGLSLRLPTPEDLVIMKIIAHRAKDLEDIRGLLKKNPCLDKARILHWVEQFSVALENPELQEIADKILKE
jgi:hypothetical protein